MIKRRNLRTRAIKLFVLDEADEMLDKGFKEQIYDVYRYLPPGTQVVLLSATMPHEILEMTSKFMTNAVRILVKRWVFYSYVCFPRFDHAILFEWCRTGHNDQSEAVGARDTSWTSTTRKIQQLGYCIRTQPTLSRNLGLEQNHRLLLLISFFQCFINDYRRYRIIGVDPHDRRKNFRVVFHKGSNETVQPDTEQSFWYPSQSASVYPSRLLRCMIQTALSEHKCRAFWLTDVTCHNGERVNCHPHPLFTVMMFSHEADSAKDRVADFYRGSCSFEPYPFHLFTLQIPLVSMKPVCLRLCPAIILQYVAICIWCSFVCPFSTLLCSFPYIPRTLFQWWTYTGGYQAVLRCCRTGRMEVRHTMWSVWHSYHHTVSHLLQH